MMPESAQADAAQAAGIQTGPPLSGPDLSSLLCPACVQEGMPEPGRIMTLVGRFTCKLNPAHAWVDRELFDKSVRVARRVNPAAYPTPDKPKVEKRREIVISEEAKGRLETALGTEFNSAADLIGEIFALNEEVERLKAKEGELAAAGGGGDIAGLSFNEVVFTVPEWAMSGVQEHANYGQKTIQQYLQEWFGGFIDAEYDQQER